MPERHYRLCLLPGDGIGPEVISAAVEVLHAAARRFGFTLASGSYPMGGAGLIAAGDPLPAATLAAAQAADAVLLGAVGAPEFDREPPARKPESGLLRLRSALGAFANLRPIRHYPGVGSIPLKDEWAAGADFLIVRELTGGIYFGQPRGFEASRQAAFNTMRYSVGEIERVARVAFALAAERRGKLASVDKANVLETSQLWRETVTRLAPDFAGVSLEHLYIDNAAMQILLRPRDFDVILTANLFGDILSDEAAVLAGSLGLLPSASLGGPVGLYEPVHGSAPALAGQDVANPLGAILSAAMLLRHSCREPQAAAAIEAAVLRALEDGLRTRDLDAARPLGCRAMAAAVIARL